MNQRKYRIVKKTYEDGREFFIPQVSRGLFGLGGYKSLLPVGDEGYKAENGAYTFIRDVLYCENAQKTEIVEYPALEE